MKSCKHTRIITGFFFLLSFTRVLAGGNFIDDTTSRKTACPCDLYAAGGTPCVTAHSTTRVLFASYQGPLYQVMRQSDGKTLDISVNAGGFANATAQDAFCINSNCWITKIYDQTGKHNDLVQAAPGTFRGPDKGGFNHLPIADMAPVMIDGHKAYGVYIMPGMGLRNNDARDLAIDDEPEGIYYVVDGTHFDSGCCFDYGNASTNGRAVGTGTMETTYFGTSTAWGSGNGKGPWIMADLEAGLFSGYNAKRNDVPSITNWPIVSAFVDGGGGNLWDLRGGNAQSGELTTFYSGARPGTPGSNAYYPMNKKGGVLLGNGGDNGNGSSGTFYEGVMTTGFPSFATTDAVQANIVAAKYSTFPLQISRPLTFSPRSRQTVTLTFTNTTGAPVNGLKLSLQPRNGWTITKKDPKPISSTVSPNESVTAAFDVTSPNIADFGFLSGQAEWMDAGAKKKYVESIVQRIRSAQQVKINEVRFNTGNNATNQFIELYNASAADVDISNWKIVHAQNGSAGIQIATIPAGKKLRSHEFYLLGLSASALVAPAKAGDSIIYVQRNSGIEEGKVLSIDGETPVVASMGTAASPMTTLFVPVSTGPWLHFPAGTKNLPVTNATGFVVGQKIGIDAGGNYEVATVTAVGKAGTQTVLVVAAKAGDKSIKVQDNVSMTPGDILIINTGARKETVKVKRIVNVVTAPVRGASGEAGEVELELPLRLNHMTGVDVAGPGTGISFTPATRFSHKSGDAIQGLGAGIKLKRMLAKSHNTGAPVFYSQVPGAGYEGVVQPDQWFGWPLSNTGGSIALTDAGGKVLIDGIVYGSQQSNSSANGTITSPEIAILEGDQGGGGCLMVVPALPKGLQQQFSPKDQTNKSYGLFPDGNDHDNNCSDFLVQNSTTLGIATTPGNDNIKVSNITGLVGGQKLIIGSGSESETVTIASIGTAGGSTFAKTSEAGTRQLLITSSAGFSTGQLITIGNGQEKEELSVVSIIPARRRFGNTANMPDTIEVNTPLKFSHPSGTVVAGSGVTLTAPLTKPHDSGTPVSSHLPTPGRPNEYVLRRE